MKKEVDSGGRADHGVLYSNGENIWRLETTRATPNHGVYAKKFLRGITMNVPRAGAVLRSVQWVEWKTRDSIYQ